MVKKKYKSTPKTVVVRNRPYGSLAILAFFLVAFAVWTPNYLIWYLGVLVLATAATLFVRNDEVLQIEADALTLYLRDDWNNVSKLRISEEDLISWSVNDDSNKLRVSYYDKETDSVKMQIVPTANLMGISRQFNKHYRERLNSRRIANSLIDKLHGAWKGFSLRRKSR